ncbi:MAG: DUF3429 domain-containing protein [Rhizobacter sp.]|nr:DUF3429 domain-containing protein [Rhizobacter sp.]
MTGNAGPSPWARRLALGGLIPFVGLAAALWVVPAEMPLARQALPAALLGYGATISSFLGAIHWGLVMRDGPAQPVSSLLWGVVPSLLAWVALLLGQAPGLLLVAAVLWACFVVDRVLYPRYQLDAWLPMRWRLSVLASLSCVAGAAALLR